MPKIFLLLILVSFGMIMVFDSCQKQVDYSSDISALQSSVQALQIRCDSLSQALTATNSNVASLGTSIDSIRIELATITTQINQLDSQLNTVNANISSINTQLTKLNLEYENLLAEINTIVGNSLFKFNIGMDYVGIDSMTDRAPVYDTTKWHYIAISVDTSRQVIIYVDGIQRLNYYRDDKPYVYSDIYIGASLFTSFSYFYDGLIDELRISNVVRTQEEIQDYYTASAVSSSQSLDNNTIGLWHFDEASGTSFANAVSGSPTGILHGKTSFVSGKAGNAISFDGQTGYGDCQMGLPSSPLTFEFWFKTNNVSSGSLVQPYGLYSSNIGISP